MSGSEALLLKARGAAICGETAAARALYHEALTRIPRSGRARAALETLRDA